MPVIASLYVVAQSPKHYVRLNLMTLLWEEPLLCNLCCNHIVSSLRMCVEKVIDPQWF